MVALAVRVGVAFDAILAGADGARHIEKAFAIGHKQTIKRRILPRKPIKQLEQDVGSVPVEIVKTRKMVITSGAQGESEPDHVSWRRMEYRCNTESARSGLAISQSLRLNSTKVAERACNIEMVRRGCPNYTSVSLIAWTESANFG